MKITFKICPVDIFHDLTVASAPAVYKIFPTASVAMVVTAPE